MLMPFVCAALKAVIGGLTLIIIMFWRYKNHLYVNFKYWLIHRILWIIGFCESQKSVNYNSLKKHRFYNNLSYILLFFCFFGNFLQIFDIGLETLIFFRVHPSMGGNFDKVKTKNSDLGGPHGSKYVRKKLRCKIFSQYRLTNG